MQLRDYQYELVEKGVQGLNCVICAPTGSGKTVDAAHIIREHLLDRESTKQPINRVGFFLEIEPTTSG